MRRLKLPFMFLMLCICIQSVGFSDGYRPVITTLPTGTSMNGRVIVSADRRYVRISLSPNFTQVTEVNTFNFISGQGRRIP